MAGGETSFTDGGFGKSRYGGSGPGDFALRFQAAEAAIEWTPRLNWDWTAVVDVGYQPRQEHTLDVLQAYLLFKPTPRSPTRFSARFGYFYPPISLEHDARIWGVTDTITPSAINSWVGEEVKGVGAEATVSHDFGAFQLAATAGLFGFGDTAGTLIAFRGWSLSDVKSQIRGSFPLPPQSPYVSAFQDNETYTSRWVDHRVGYYGKLEWRPSEPFTLDAVYYDNRGDGVSVDADAQWAWSTRFLDVGATARLGPHTWLKAQALNGRTAIGPETRRLVDVGFRAAYLLASQDLGKSRLTVRADAFATSDHAPRPPASLGENGWALTTAWRYPLSNILDFRLEGLRIVSNRASRVLAGDAAHQSQTVLQSSLRLSF